MCDVSRLRRIQVFCVCVYVFTLEAVFSQRFVTRSPAVWIFCSVPSVRKSDSHLANFSSKLDGFKPSFKSARITKLHDAL